MNYITKDNYRTPDGKRALWDKLLFSSRFYFLFKYFGIVLRSRKLAIKGIYNTEAWSDSSIETFRALESAGGIFNLQGIDQFAKEKGPFVFVSNHMSVLETMIFPGLIVPIMDLTVVAKKSLTTYPFFGPIFRARNPIMVERENSRDDLMIVLSEGKKNLEQGNSILLFPQSTRRKDVDPASFNSLAVKLAKKAGVKVVPVAIKTDFWENGRLVKDFGPLNRKKEIYFNFGKPIEIKGNGKEENQDIIEFIQKNLEQWNG